MDGVERRGALGAETFLAAGALTAAFFAGAAFAGAALVDAAVVVAGAFLAEAVVLAGAAFAAVFLTDVFVAEAFVAEAFLAGVFLAVAAFRPGVAAAGPLSAEVEAPPEPVTALRAPAAILDTCLAAPRASLATMT